MKFNYFRVKDNQLFRGTPQELFPQSVLPKNVSTALFKSIGGIIVESPDNKRLVSAVWENGQIVTEFEDIIPEPNYQGFLNACDLPELGGNGIFAELLMIDKTISLNVYQLLLRMNDGVGGELELRTIQFMYGLVTPALSKERLQVLRDTILEYNIPIQV